MEIEVKAYELFELTKQAIAKRNAERPAELFVDLILRMKDAAVHGQSYIGFVFSDGPEIVAQVLDRLREEGYIITKQDRGVIRISWQE